MIDRLAAMGLGAVASYAANRQASQQSQLLASQQNAMAQCDSSLVAAYRQALLIHGMAGMANAHQTPSWDTPTDWSGIPDSVMDQVIRGWQQAEEMGKAFLEGRSGA